MIAKIPAVLICALLATLVYSCNEPAKVAEPPKVETPKLKMPFRFQKTIEVRPGLTFDILSWGRGSSSVGAYVILRSDSIKMKYTTTSGELDGQILDVFNTDLDVDGNPEIIIQAKASDSTAYAEMYAYEFNNYNDQPQKLNFPKLTSNQKKGYKGSDHFYIDEGKLMREFPVDRSEITSASDTASKRLFRYTLRNNSFVVRGIKSDGTEIAEAAAVAPVVKRPAAKKKAAPKKSAKTQKKTVKKTTQKSTKK
jgi:hypothetical protein